MLKRLIRYQGRNGPVAGFPLTRGYSWVPRASRPALAVGVSQFWFHKWPRRLAGTMDEPQAVYAAAAREFSTLSSYVPFRALLAHPGNEVRRVTIQGFAQQGLVPVVNVTGSRFRQSTWHCTGSILTGSPVIGDRPTCAARDFRNLRDPHRKYRCGHLRQSDREPVSHRHLCGRGIKSCR